MNDEMLKLAGIIEDCVKSAMDDMGESIHELSLFCTVPAKLDHVAKMLHGLKLENASLQAKIDALMLEYCPDEMTEEQLKMWGDSQRELQIYGN